MLTSKIMRQFRIERDWGRAGYFETVRAKEISADIRTAIMAGKLVAVSGPVGVGKTAMVKQLQRQIVAPVDRQTPRCLASLDDRALSGHLGRSRHEGPDPG